MTQQATEPQAPRLLTVAEAREQLGIGLSKLYELIRAGEIKAKDLNGVKGQYAAPGRPGKRRCLRIDQAEINRYLAERDA